MFFLLTNFIYPIEKPIALSKYFQFTFDNPRSKEEIDLVRELIQKAWDLSETLDDFQYQRFPLKKEVPDQDVVTFELIIKEFLQKHFGKKEAQKQMKKLEGNKKAIINFYAQNWVIVRYETKEMIKEERELQASAQKMRKKGERGIIILEDEHIFERREKQLVDFSYLVSLLAATGDYFGWNFLTTESSYEIKTYSPRVYIMRYILEQALVVKSKSDDESSYSFNFDVFIKSVSEKIRLLDKRLREQKINEDLILYIGDVLESGQPIKNNKFSSLVRLVSIIEMLVAHQPDFTRFNVEDSITRQFVLKTSILVHRENQQVNLEKVKSKLKEIYTQRSNIVHGNFPAVNKFIKELKKKGEYFDSLIEESYKFVQVVINSYLQNPKFVEFLKQN